MRSTHLIIALSLGLVALAGGAWLALAGAATEAPPISTWDAADPRLGEKAYVMCQSCHGLDGRGVPGFAPPLAGSRWLAGPALPAILITLHGYDATSEPGAPYASARMLGQAHQLADHEIAALLTVLRARWGGAAAVTPAEVGTVRARFASRTAPWTPAELRALGR